MLVGQNGTAKKEVRVADSREMASLYIRQCGTGRMEIRWVLLKNRNHFNVQFL